MNMHDNDSHERDHAFDQAMRRLHAQAVEQVSPATRARLRTARHASAEAARAPHRGWVWASGAVAVFALAIGLRLHAPAPVVETPAVAAVESSYDADSAIASLDENPDLYLWLASNDDAVAAVTEQ